MAPATARLQERTLFRPFWLSLWRYRDLIWQLSVREVRGRYRGSLFGLAWALVTPLAMLLIYTFVFGVVFKARWPTPSGAPATGGLAEFALTLFAGQILFQLFAEIVSRAPGLIVGVPNYVKKVVFPLDILLLPVAVATLFHFLVATGILIAFSCYVHGGVPWTALLLPVVVLPVMLLALGLGWLLASVGVFFRDTGQGIGIVLQVLLFATPVFYPASALGPTLSPLLYLNPLTVPVEGARQVLVLGLMPDWAALGWVTLGSLVAAQLGYLWFMNTNKMFADVL